MRENLTRDELTVAAAEIDRDENMARHKRILELGLRSRKVNYHMIHWIPETQSFEVQIYDMTHEEKVPEKYQGFPIKCCQASRYMW